jgi:hypothetical protein
MTTALPHSRFCSVCARQAGLSPLGYGGAEYEIIIAAELPLPWPMGMYSDPARLTPEILAVMQHIRAEYQRSHTGRIGILGIAPDPEYSMPGRRRVIAWQRPEGPFAQFERCEYLVPDDRFGPLVYALALTPERLDAFADDCLEPADVRDLLVCTHGSVDAACSKFGYPTYARLRQIAADSGGRLRAWRTTHFGGHVFAPTLIDMPHGSYWAYIEQDAVDWLVARTGDTAGLREHYRGWGGLPAPFLQVLECELFIRYGWQWLQYTKSGRIIARDEIAQPDAHGHAEPAWAEVRLEYIAPNGITGATIARIEQTTTIEVMHTSGNEETYPYPQYTVAWLRDEHI